MKGKIVFLGGGGHAKVLIELVRQVGGYEIVGILDPCVKPGTEVVGVAVLGNDYMLSELIVKDVGCVCIAVGSTRENFIRSNLFAKVLEAGFNVPTFIHPSVYLAEGVSLGRGVQIMAGAIIQCDAVVGDNSIINTGAIVEHDVVIGAGVHVCAGAVLTKGVKVADGIVVNSGVVVTGHMS